MCCSKGHSGVKKSPANAGLWVDTPCRSGLNSLDDQRLGLRPQMRIAFALRVRRSYEAVEPRQTLTTNGRFSIVETVVPQDLRA